MNFFLTHNGKLSIRAGDDIISKVSMEIEYFGDKFNFLFSKSEDWAVNNDCAISKNSAGDVFTLRLGEINNNVVVTPSIKINGCTGYKNVLKINVRGYIDDRPKVVIFNESSKENGNHCLYSMSSPALTTNLVRDQKVFGTEFVAYKSNNYYGVLGVITFNHYFTGVSLTENGQFSIEYFCNESWKQLGKYCLEADEKVELDSFAIITKQPEDALNEYGKAIAAKVNPHCNKKVYSGWCSWYYYGPNIEEKIILDNVEIIKRNDIPFEAIVIDDGWQINYGDWEANNRFPGGMKKLADCIKDAGLIPGIWVAPFLFHKNSTEYIKHPEWFIKEGDDKIFIDYSNEGAQKYLYDLFYKLTAIWGYRYIKIDFISVKLALDGYKINRFNALKNMQKAYEIIKKAITQDTYLLGCSSPLGALSGNVDSIRCGVDILELWSSLKDVAQQISKRLYINHYATVDPDCLLIRTKEKHEVNCYRLCVRDKEEIRTFVTFISVCGGTYMNSDNLALLDKEDFNMLKYLFPLNEKPCKVLDLYERAVPSLYKYDTGSNMQMYAVINWNDITTGFSLQGVYGAFVKRFWKGSINQRLESSDEFKITLSPHTSEILYFSDDLSFLQSMGNSIMPVV